MVMRLVAFLGAVTFAFNASAQQKPAEKNQCEQSELAPARARVFEGKVLRSSFLSSDVAKLLACDAGGNWLSSADADGITAGYTAYVVRSDKLTQPHLVEGRVCSGDGCEVEVYLRNDLKPDPTTFGMGGGLPFAKFLGHLGKAGHFEMTVAALKSSTVQASADSVALMAAAARDPDYFEWSTPAAHSQTSNDDRGIINQSQAEAREKFITWMTGSLARVSKLCKAGSYREAAYALGYSLHGVQDLAFHEGISNAEHSYLDNGDPKLGVDYSDRYELKFRTGTDLSIALLGRVKQVVHSACWTGMTQLKGAQPLANSEKRVVLGNSMDFGIGPLFAYKGLAGEVQDRLLDGVKDAELFVKPRWATDPGDATVQANMKQMVDRAF